MAQIPHCRCATCGECPNKTRNRKGLCTYCANQFHEADVDADLSHRGDHNNKNPKLARNIVTRREKQDQHCSRCHGTGKSPKYDAPCANCVSLGICPKCSEKLLRTSEAYYVCTACNSGLIAVPKHDPAKAAAQVDEFLKNAQKIIARGDRLKK